MSNRLSSFVFLLSSSIHRSCVEVWRRLRLRGSLVLGSQNQNQKQNVKCFWKVKNVKSSFVFLLSSFFFYIRSCVVCRRLRLRGSLVLGSQNKKQKQSVKCFCKVRNVKSSFVFRLSSFFFYTSFMCWSVNTIAIEG